MTCSACFLGGGGSDDLAPASSTAVGSLMVRCSTSPRFPSRCAVPGCSGGAFDLFGWPTTYDGYDAVETVAARTGSGQGRRMGGISFSGISQLFTAGTRPPLTAAVSPFR